MKRTFLTVQDIADVLDHSLLRPDMAINELIEGCKLARKYNTVSVCVRPSDVELVCQELVGSNVLPTTVIGFPHGSSTIETKVFEVHDVIKRGAVECDVVMNVSRLVSGQIDYVLHELSAIVDAAHGGDAILKVIFENYYLTDEQIIQACEIAKQAGADYIKTSTGYANGGATMADIKLMMKHANGMNVKAAGGIRTLDDCLAMMALGVKRFGTRASESILKEAKERENAGNLYIERL